MLKSGALKFDDAAGKTLGQSILELFRANKGIVLSGAELGNQLNISRTAVWKHVNTLRTIGYRIEAVPARGYRLLASPDLFLPVEIQSGLITKRIGNKIICFTETNSTNTVAFKLAEDGAPEGTVVLADSQSRGKGRLGREWSSPPGVNLYASIILRPPVLPLEASQLTFISAVAVARTVEQVTSLKVRIKWPNDLLLDGRKFAGLLNEMSAETEKINFVVMGIGVNINMLAGQFPADLRYPATSLLIEGGCVVERNSFVRILLREMDNIYDRYLQEGDQPVREEWLQRSRMVGCMVNVNSSGKLISGMVTGIDQIGALLLRLADGSEERILAGDVTIL